MNLYCDINNVFFLLLCVRTLTVQVYKWAWNHGECTAWNERLGRRVRPGSPEMRGDRRLGEAGSLCMLWEGSQMR